MLKLQNLRLEKLLLLDYATPELFDLPTGTALHIKTELSPSLDQTKRCDHISLVPLGPFHRLKAIYIVPS